MRTFFLFSLYLMVTGCSMSPPVKERASVPPSHRCVPEADSACATYEMRACHELFVDGCLSGHTKRHECVARHGPACAQNVEWECPEGFVDGCDLEDMRTQSHICLPTNGGVACDQELALDCPIGFVDLCSLKKK